MYNLTPGQKDLLRWFVQQVRDGNLQEEFTIIWVTHDKALISDFKDGGSVDIPNLTRGALDALTAAGLILCDLSYETKAK